MKNKNTIFRDKALRHVDANKNSLLQHYLKLVLLLGLSYVSIPVHADEKSANSNTVDNPYFSHIKLPCGDQNNSDKCFNEFRSHLKTLKNCKQNSQCDSGDKILGQLFGESYRKTLADYLVYFEIDKDAVIKQHQPVIMYDSKSTPYLDGVHYIYPLVFSEKRICLTASITTDYRNEPNPFAGLFTSLGATVTTTAPKASESKSERFTWYPLSGNPNMPILWMAFVRLPVDINTSNRLIVQYRTPGDFTEEQLKSFSANDPCIGQGNKEQAVELKGSMDVSNADKSKNNPKSTTAGKTETEKHELKLSGSIKTPPAKDDNNKAKGYEAEFLAASAFFSNSPDSNTAMSFALGVTGAAHNTSLGRGGSSIGVSGYVLAKYYITRPILKAEPSAIGINNSHALFLGTNLTNHAFDELVFGYAWGHLKNSNAGFLFGANLVNSKDDDSDPSTKHGRKIRAFIGIDYTL